MEEEPEQRDAYSLALEEAKEICKNNFDSVQRLQEILQEFPLIVEAELDYNHILLHEAIRNNCRADIIGLLMQAWPESLQKRDFLSKLPVHLACEVHSSSTVIKMIADAYADGLEHRDQHQQLPLFTIVKGEREKSDKMDIIEHFLHARPKTINKRGFIGENILHMALLSADVHKQLVDKLLTKKRELIQETDKYGRTPLHYACKERLAPCIRYIFGLCPQVVQVADAVGDHPLHVALQRDPKMDFELLEDMFRAWSGVAAKAGRDGYLPLHWYIKGEPTGTTELLFLSRILHASPAAVTSMTEQGQVPLHLACQSCKDWNVVRLLIIFGPEASRTVDSYGNLPLHYAMKNEMEVPTSVVDQLASHCPETLTQPANRVDDGPRFLPIYYAIRNGNEATVRLMCDLNPECTRTVSDPKGRLPLHIACRYGKASIIEHLLPLYPEATHVRDKKTKLPIHYIEKHEPQLPSDLEIKLVAAYPEGIFKPYKEHSPENTDVEVEMAEINDDGMIVNEEADDFSVEHARSINGEQSEGSGDEMNDDDDGNGNGNGIDEDNRNDEDDDDDDDDSEDGDDENDVDEDDNNDDDYEYDNED